MGTVLLWLWAATFWFLLSVPIISFLSKIHSVVWTNFSCVIFIKNYRITIVKNPIPVRIQISTNPKKKDLKMDNNRGISNWNIIGQVIGCIGISINLFFFFILLKEHSISDSLSILTSKFNVSFQTILNSIDYVHQSTLQCAQR